MSVAPASDPGWPSGLRFIERDWLSANMIVAQDGEALTVIDTGYESHADMTARLVDHALSRVGAGARLVRIINTHLHSDHCGGNARLQSAHDARALVPAATLAAVREWDEDALTYRGTGQHCPRFRADGALSPGDRFEAGGIGWEAHSAPGHDPHSLVFFAPRERLLISADALWQRGFGIIFPELLDESGFAEQAAVLDLIEQLAPRRVLPGHGPMFDALEPALEEARARLAALRADPARNCRSALRALVMFRMLALGRARRDALGDLLEHASIMAAAADRLGQSLPAAIDDAIGFLVRSGQLEWLADGRIAVRAASV